MSVSTISVNIPLVITVLSAAALVSGCSSGRQSSYHSTASTPPTYAAGGTSGGMHSQSASMGAGASDQYQAGTGAAGQTSMAQGGTGEDQQGALAQPGTIMQSATNMVMPLFQESVQVGKRVVDAGSVTVRKTVRTETVNQPVELRTESVVIDRVPATDQSAQQNLAGAQTTTQPFQEGEITIRLQREEPVIQRQVVPAGSIVATVRPQTQQTTIESQVRREEVAVDQSGNPQNVSIAADVTRAGGADQERAVGASGDVGGQSRGTGAGVGAGNVISDLNTLTTTTSPATLAGRQVQLSGVQVQEIVGDRLVAIGTEGGSPIYVRLQQPMSNISSGDRVNLTGTVNQVSSTTINTLGLDDEATQALQNQSIYVDAQRVEVAR